MDTVSCSVRVRADGRVSTHSTEEGVNREIDPALHSAKTLQAADAAEGFPHSDDSAREVRRLEQTQLQELMLYVVQVVRHHAAAWSYIFIYEAVSSSLRTWEDRC